MTRCLRFTSVFLLLASFGRADLFTVTMDTSPLVGSAFAPFALNFQLNGGNDNNQAILSGFNFAGGGLLGLPALEGGASGDLGGSVILRDSDPFVNSFTQSFTPGNSLGFLLSITTNPDVFFFDLFSFAIFFTDPDTLLQFEIPTQSFFNAFATIEITDIGLDIATAASDPAQFPGIELDAPVISPVVAAVPEPSTWLLMAGALTALGIKRGLERRKSGRASRA